MGKHFDPKKFDKSTVNKEIVDFLRDEWEGLIQSLQTLPEKVFLFLIRKRLN